MFIEYGVPQGSVLGPLLFILYTNDLPNSLRHSKSILVADDTTVYITGKDLQAMYSQVNYDINALNDWFKAHRLSVNPSKTKYILFMMRGMQNINNHNYYRHIDNDILERVEVTKFLGIFIDQSLSWQHHINRCKSKISSGVYAIQSWPKVLDQHEKNVIFQTSNLMFRMTVSCEKMYYKTICSSDIHNIMGYNIF